MGKAYRGQLCVYCSERLSTTADHVFAREFFLVDDRVNLPKVPACAECNGQKSRVEHYAATLLPFGARHPAAAANLTSMVPKRLRRNLKLHRQLMQGQSRAWATADNGLILPTLAFPMEEGQVEKLFTFVARGLLWHHWRSYLRPGEHAILTAVVNAAGVQFFDEHLFSRKVRHRITANLGNGTFLYEGVQGVDDDALSAWRFSIYDGVTFSDGQGGSASQVVAVSGLARTIEQLRHMVDRGI